MVAMLILCKLHITSQGEPFGLLCGKGAVPAATCVISSAPYAKQFYSVDI